MNATQEDKDKPTRRPRWQIELEAHNGLPTNATSTSRSRRNSRVSVLAAQTEATTAVSAAAAAVSVALSEDEKDNITKKRKSLAVRRTSTSSITSTDSGKEKGNKKIARLDSTAPSSSSSSKPARRSSNSSTTSSVPKKNQNKDTNEKKLTVKKEEDDEKKIILVKKKDGKRPIPTKKVYEREKPKNTNISAKNINQAAKVKSKKVPAKKKNPQVKHTAMYNDTTTANVAAVTARKNILTLNAPASYDMIVVPPAANTQYNVVSINAGSNNLNPDVTDMKNKGKIRKPRRRIPKNKEYIPTNEQPVPADVVGGRGGRSNHHPGNRPYWRLILENRTRYKNCRGDKEKARIANEILMCVQQSFGGRFLNIDSSNKRWFILPDAVVLDKIKQALRDKYVPFWAKDLKNKTSSDETALAIKANATQKNAFKNLGATTGTTGNNATNSINPNNNLNFLFNSPAGRYPQTATLPPTVDDILKAKIDQMPSFNNVAPNGAFPPQASFGIDPLNPYPAMFPPTWMGSIGMGMGMGMNLGAFGGGSTGNNLDASHGFGGGVNLGAPAMPPMMGGFSPSIGLLQGMDMKSLDNYMEQQGMMLSGISSTAAAASLKNTVASSAKKSLLPKEGSTTASTVQPKPTTDWNAMYASALSNS